MKQPLQPSLFADSVPIKEVAARRKRLGQYFTGEKLARLLVALAHSTHYRSAIDPMCGSGDMLSAVRSISPNVLLAGIEIDRSAYELCLSRLTNLKGPISVIHANAFSWSAISSLPATSFDLVITNPPYVRYQSYAGDRGSEHGELPGAEDVRRGLIEIAQKIIHLDEKDRKILISIIQTYSGLSDLAVPSWILCMMLTAVGGRLALIVPEAWLNRDYAYPIHYLLLKLFRIQYVVEDANRVWFAGTQIKTTLLVAERVQRAENLRMACAQQTYVHASLPASSISKDSIVGGLFSKDADPDAAFAQVLFRLNKESELDSTKGFKVTKRDLGAKLNDLLAAASDSKWLRACEPELTQSAAKEIHSGRRDVKIPQVLLKLLPTGKNASFTTIEALGGRVGQGLRTGANEFFYCDLISELGNECLVSPGKRLGLPPVLVPRQALRTVVRKQSEIPKGYLLDSSTLVGRALILDGFIHPNNVVKIKGEWGRIQLGLDLMSSPLASFITQVEGLNIGTDDQPKKIPHLTAVRTNETKGRNGSPVRFWYMLPPFTDRHLPALFIPRINYLHPKTFLNSKERVLIDANFSTIWLNDNAKVDAFALLACLNSSWILATMELNASVLGGGALKLEATHLRRLPLPVLSDGQWGDLSRLGRKLATGDHIEKTLDEINRQIAYALFGIHGEFALEKIEQIKRERLEARHKK